MKIINDVEINPSAQVIWLNKKARALWETTINDINRLVHDLEIKSVVYGDRKASWITIDEEELPDLAYNLAKQGVSVFPVKYVGKWEGFAHRTIQPEKGKPKNVSVVISRGTDIALDFKDAHDRGDNIRQGDLLGFPKCCSTEFERTWSKKKIDPIWDMAMADKSALASPAGNILEVRKVHPFSNPLLRYIGVRVGFHIPCSFNCKDTIALSEKRLRYADVGLVKLMKALLSMPMSWDCYHGVSIVRTPIFYVVYNSNVTEERYVVEVPGTWTPKEAVPGGVYPLTGVK